MTSSFQPPDWVNPANPPVEPTVETAGLGQRLGAEIADGLLILTFYLMAAHALGAPGAGAHHPAGQARPPRRRARLGRLPHRPGN